jgi:hypothetical protein
MTKAETIIIKEAKFGKTLLTLGTAGALSVLPAKASGQLKWFAKPLVKALADQYPMPALDTIATSTGPVKFVQKGHPRFNEFQKEIREAMDDTTLGFKGFSVDTAKSGKRRFVNAFGIDDGGDVTHRLFRDESFGNHPHLKDRAQWVDEVKNKEAVNFIQQRERAWAAKNKKNVATK